VVDPGSPAARVDDLAVILEHIAPGDQIPLHSHRVNEVIVIHGDGTFRIGGEARNPAPGTESDKASEPLTYDVRTGQVTPD
jgi:quercetin dioxygenase-like cupin family protein